MGNNKTTGLISRLMMGKEKSEDYARGTLPSNRWELFWDIFKGRFGKLIMINLLVGVFCIPLVMLFMFRNNALRNFGGFYPFSQGLGLGYMAPVNMVGYAENIVVQVNAITFLALPIVAMILAVGLAGGAYVMRNMVWTEGVFMANDFWKGIKDNIKQMLLIVLTFSLLFYILIMTISLCQQYIASGYGIKAVWIICQIISYVMAFILAVMTLFMITMTVTYNLKFRHLIKNAFLFTIALLPFNIFFVLLCLIPFVFLVFGSFFKLFGIIIVFLFGIALALLIWTNYSQWAFDKFINDKVDGAQKNRGMYEKVKKNDAESINKYKEQLALAKHNSLNNRPIKPIDDDFKLAELPTNFSRADLERLRASKQAIYDDHAKYVEEHKDDEQFKLSAEEQAIIDKNLAEKNKRIEKAKKALSKHNKNK